ncbi:MAG: hypothetical protein FK730_04445 [Asgard group archaeon]|nr:hypothetical protein [Asgard group archaeon]
MFQELFSYYFIQNPVAISPYHKLAAVLFICGSIFSAAFLGLFAWSFVTFIRAKKLGHTSKKFLPHVLSFSLAFILAVICLVLSYII